MKSVPLALGDLKWDAVPGFGWGYDAAFAPENLVEQKQ